MGLFSVGPVGIGRVTVVYEVTGSDFWNGSGAVRSGVDGASSRIGLGAVTVGRISLHGIIRYCTGVRETRLQVSVSTLASYVPPLPCTHTYV